MFLQVFLACVMAWVFMNAARWTVNQIGIWYVTRRFQRMASHGPNCGCAAGTHPMRAHVSDDFMKAVDAQQRLTVAVLDLGVADQGDDIEKRDLATTKVVDAARRVFETMTPQQREFLEHVRGTVASREAAP